MTLPSTPGPGVRPIDLRIVVDGASTAGKTTTARSLGRRLGRPLETPEERDGRQLAPVGAGTLVSGSSPDGPFSGAIDRPEHDHPRAWWRWFDR